MLRRFRPRLSFSNVTSLLALFVALGGTSAYAINEWTGANIVNESLTGADVKGRPDTSATAGVDGSLTGADISGQAARSVHGTPFVDGSLTGADVQDNTLRGADVATGSIAGTDIVNSSVSNLDIANDIITSPKILNGSLNASDISEGTFVNFVADIGVVNARQCDDIPVTGVHGEGDHLLLTARYGDADPNLSYTTLYSTAAVAIRVCNPQSSAINDSTTSFNLLVIDAGS
jgi:hypothetical protein